MAHLTQSIPTCDKQNQTYTKNEEKCSNTCAVCVEEKAAQCYSDAGFCSLKSEETEWLTTKEAAEYLRLSVGVLRNLTSNGQIPYYKLGRSNRYHRTELKKLLFEKKRGVFYVY